MGSDLDPAVVAQRRRPRRFIGQRGFALLTPVVISRRTSATVTRPVTVANEQTLPRVKPDSGAV